MRVWEPLTSVELGGEDETEGMAGRIIPALGVLWQRLDASTKCLLYAEPLPMLPAASPKKAPEPARADQLGAKGEIRLIELLCESKRNPPPASILLTC